MAIPSLDGQSIPELLEMLSTVGKHSFLLLETNGLINFNTGDVSQLLDCPEDLEGINLSKILDEELCQKLLKPRQKLFECEQRVGARNLKFSLFPYKDNDDQSKKMILVITPVKQEGQERFSSMGELAASIAHEIRNPMAAILTTAETMKEDFDTDDDRREYLERIITEINRVNLFLVKFLALARPQKPQFVTSSLTDIADNVIYLENKEIERQNIQCIKEYEHGLPDISVDPNQIQQVFLNLILNSIQAMPSGGQLQVKIKNDRETSKKAQFVKVEITDSGCGIEPENIKQIFVPFFSTKPKGVGLGLSVSQQILKDHHGNLNVESAPDRGTTFSFKLPIDQKNKQD